MTESVTLSRRKLAAVSHNNTGCFPWTLGIGAVMVGIAFLNEATLTTHLVLIGVTALLARIVMPGWLQRRRFAQQSVVTRGVITRLSHTIVEDGEGGKSTQYHFAYTFPNGRETWQSITAQQCLFAEPGAVVSVRYLPDQPHLSQVDWELTLSEKLRAIEQLQP